MPRGNSFEELAREADERIAKARQLGQQMALLPDDGPVEGDGGGRVARGKGKAQSQLREWLATQGCKMPEDQLAEMAGLRTRDDVIVWAQAQAERMLSWQYAGAVRITPKGDEVAARPTATARGEAFKLFYMAAMRAAEAMMPYGAAKVTPDATVQQNNTFIVPAPSADRRVPGDDARVVTGRRTGPPPMPWEVEGNQSVSGGDDD